MIAITTPDRENSTPRDVFIDTGIAELHKGGMTLHLDCMACVNHQPTGINKAYICMRDTQTVITSPTQISPVFKSMGDHITHIGAKVSEAGNPGEYSIIIPGGKDQLGSIYAAARESLAVLRGIDKPIGPSNPMGM